MRWNTQKNEADESFNNLILTLPNLAHASVPVGPDESANEEIKVHGDKPAFILNRKDMWIYATLWALSISSEVPNCRAAVFCSQLLGRAPGTGDDLVSA